MDNKFDEEKRQWYVKEPVMYMLQLIFIFPLFLGMVMYAPNYAN